MRQNHFMQKALEQAKKAFREEEVPVGAVIVEDGNIIASAHNQNIILKDPTAHAEIIALRQAALFKKDFRLNNCDIYITLEPCLMCAAALSLARIRRIYYAASDKKFGAIECVQNPINSSSCYHKSEIYSGIGEEESKKLMQDFFKSRR